VLEDDDVCVCVCMYLPSQTLPKGPFLVRRLDAKNMVYSCFLLLSCSCVCCACVCVCVCVCVEGE
jgi:hypothetical protein